MKILFVAPGLGYGGAERVISLLSNAFSEMGDELYILTSISSAKPAYYINDKIKVIQLNTGDSKGIIAVLKSIKLIRNNLKFYMPDVVVPFLTHVIVHTAIANIGLRYTIIASERNDPARTLDKGKQKVYQVLRKLLYPLIDGFVFQSKGAMSYFPQKIQERSIIILNPLNIQKLPKKWIHKRRNEIVSVGRLEDQKNQLLLIEAYAQLKDNYADYRLIIYGEGSLRTKLQHRINQLGLENNIILYGNTDNILDHLNGASLFVLTSNYEGLPNALIEAMAVGLPCISTNCSPGGAAMLINNYENGILIPCNDIEALKEAIIYMLTNTDKANQMALKASEIANQVSVSTIAEQWRSYFETINSNKK